MISLRVFMMCYRMLVILDDASASKRDYEKLCLHRSTSKAGHG
jgi:hypothetical protein